jgi:sec-independent protein translocase protein TatA
MPAGIGLPELSVLFVVLVVVFGLKRLPGLGRSIGTGMREFKESISGEGDSGRERRSLREG